MSLKCSTLPIWPIRDTSVTDGHPAMQTEQVATADLAGMGAAYNPRKISAHDLKALRRSLREFGTVEPIVVNRRSKTVVGGHQRVKAAEAEGIDSLPVVYVDLDETAERQLNLALNRIAGEFDRESLAAILAGLSTAGADLGLTGFTDEELDALVPGRLALQSANGQVRVVPAVFRLDTDPYKRAFKPGLQHL